MDPLVRERPSVDLRLWAKSGHFLVLQGVSAAGRPKSISTVIKNEAMSKNRKAEVDAAVTDIDFKKNDYQIELNTNHGKIVLNLLPDIAPGHCLNLIGLTKIGYYNGVIFHRVISGFMIQGGCPLGTGTGGPGYTIKAEFNATPHVDGVLSMARTSDPNSAGSQFFICLGTQSFLDRQYTAFGRTADADSLAVVKKIGTTKTDRSDKPLEAATIQSASVLVKPKA
jgi:peptidyl-prolyl cis-trans isomerase B (cyclophilin B)